MEQFNLYFNFQIFLIIHKELKSTNHYKRYYKYNTLNHLLNKDKLIL